MDVSTVAFNRNLDNPPKVENINVTFYTFVGLGYYVIGIADKSLRYCIDNPYWYDSKYITSDYFTEFNYADPEIADLSYRLKCFIITNDEYKQYVGTPLEDWLNKILIPFKIIDGKFNLVPKKNLFK